MSGDPGKALARILRGKFETFAGSTRVVAGASRSWASVTFTGARVGIAVELTGAGAAGHAADFLGALADLDLPVPGHIVADVALVAQRRSADGGHVALDLEALTIEDS